MDGAGTFAYAQGLLRGLSLVLVAGGVFCIADGRSYTDEQRARAPWLWRAYVVSGAVLVLVGVGCLAWLLTGGAALTISGIASVAAALPCLLQAWFHRMAGIDRSPLSERLAEIVARKLDAPETTRRV